jgi:two-component system NtrC family sensor kinase
MKLAGCSYQQLESTDWRELLRGVGLDIDSLDGFSGELFHAPSQRWLTLRTYTYDEGRGEVIMLHDLTEIKLVSEQLANAYQDLKATHSQLLQQEKMASIGQLAAGVAHEINNPMGFISSNLGTMGKYLERLSGFLELQSAGVAEHAPEQLREEIVQARRRFKVDYILEDAQALLAESKDGAERVRAIVQNLKSFSHVDEAQTSYVDLNQCLETTITIAWNELKYKATLIRDFGELPEVKCLPQQLNQVFLNILVNAAHAIETQGEITVTTRSAEDQVTVAIHDTGCGIPIEIRNRIFEPFFTTKEIGKGTGLGLSISYDIIKKHGGTLEVESPQGCGTTFIITLPVKGVEG